jgi:hypothetical protein
MSFDEWLAGCGSLAIARRRHGVEFKMPFGTVEGVHQGPRETSKGRSVTVSSTLAVRPNLLQDGSLGEEAAPLELRAGPLSLLFENGSLRSIRLGQREIVRRVPVAR